MTVDQFVSQMAADEVPDRRSDESGVESLEISRDLGGLVFSGSKKEGDGVRVTRRLWTQCRELIAGWFRTPRRVEMHRRQDMSWTCPDCRYRHETVIDLEAEAGKIIEVSCQACGTQHEASVLFPRQRPGTVRMTVGVVWL